MKRLVVNQKCPMLILLWMLIVSVGIQTAHAERIVKLIYLKPRDVQRNGRTIAQMKPMIRTVQRFYADQMEAHGYGRMTFEIETDVFNGLPIVHEINGDHNASHYREMTRTPDEIKRHFDISKIVQLIIIDAKGSYPGRGTGIKERGIALIWRNGFSERTVAHELGHAFGLQHDFRDDTYIMSYGDDDLSSSVLSGCSAHFLAVNPFFNRNIPLANHGAPSVALFLPNPPQYPAGASDVSLSFDVRDPDGIHQVILYAKTPAHRLFSAPGYYEVIKWDKSSDDLSGGLINFRYDGKIPTDKERSLRNPIRHTVYVTAIDKKGNRHNHYPAWTLHAKDIPPLKVPLRDRSSWVRDAVYDNVRIFIDRNVSSYDHITREHLAQINTLFVRGITDNFEGPGLKSTDFDGLTGMTTLELTYGNAVFNRKYLPGGIFEGLRSMRSLKINENPIAIPVGLEKVGANQIKAVIPNGAPLDVELPLVVVNGTLSGRATSLTVPAGHVESAPVTVIRTPGTKAAVIVDSKSLPDSNFSESWWTFTKKATSTAGLLGHYTIGYSGFMRIVFAPEPGSITPLNHRTPQVRDAIFEAVKAKVVTSDMDRDFRIYSSGRIDKITKDSAYYAGLVSEAHLATITTLDMSSTNITTLKPGDFAGLTNLTTLNLEDNKLTSLPTDMFDDLTNLENLNLGSNKLTSVPAGIGNLNNLTVLGLDYNGLTSLPAGIFDNLNNLTALGLGSNKLTSLPAGIFNGLPNLTGLALNDNNLAVLPAGIFDNLNDLIILNLSGTGLTSLPAGIRNLTSLYWLELGYNNLRSLPAGVFDNLNNLIILGLNNNKLNSLPAGIFDGTSLIFLRLDNNSFVSLPAGIFTGLFDSPSDTVVRSFLTEMGNYGDPLSPQEMQGITALLSRTAINLTGNPVNPLALIVSLENIGGGQFRAVAPAGAPFDIRLPLAVTNGSITGGATSITIPAGSVESDVLTIATPTITVDFGTLPSIPNSHRGYRLVKSDNLPLRSVLTGGLTPLSDRTRQVRKAIVKAVPGVNRAADVTEAHLAAITRLNLQDKGITALKSDDFADLPSLVTLNLSRNRLSSLPAGIFEGLPSLEDLNLSRNALSALPAGIFDELTSLIDLDLGVNALSSLPAGVFDELTSLETLGLHNNVLSSLPVGIFNSLTSLEGLTLVSNNISDVSELEGLTSLIQLFIRGNPISDYRPLRRLAAANPGLELDITIPAQIQITPVSQRTPQVRDAIVAAVPDVNSAADVTEVHLAAITSLDLQQKSIAALKSGDFDGLTALRGLHLYDNSLSSLPSDIFDDLTALRVLRLRDNRLSDLPSGIFDDLTALRFLRLDRNRLSDLPSGIFDDLTALEDLYLNGNALSSLPAGIFDNNTALTLLDLDSTSLSSLPSDIFEDLTALTSLRLNGALSSLPPGIFDNNTALTSLQLAGNPLSSLPSGIFDNNTALTSLQLTNSSSLSALPAGVFDELTTLTHLDLSYNSLSSLPSGIFDDLTALKKLYLAHNDISDVSELEGLTSLIQLVLSGNPISDYGPLRRLVAAIEAIPGHQGLTLDITIPPPIASVPITPVGDRTPQVQDAIVAAVPGVNRAADVTEAHLAAITRLNLQTKGLTTLKLGDFDGLTSLTHLYLNFNRLSSLPAGIFDELTSLTHLFLDNNSFSSLSDGIFDELTSLKELHLSDNGFSSLPSGIFDDLTSLKDLLLNRNALSSLPSGIFDKLTSLKTLHLVNNRLSSLPDGIFDDLTSLISLFLYDNQISDVSELEGLTWLSILHIRNNPISDFRPLRRLKTANPRVKIDIDINNNPPVFTDGTSTTRTIAENTAAGVNIGIPVSATDADTDALTYTLTGTDAAAFSLVSSTGQLQTRAALDYETKNAYAVIVSVSDGNSGTDSITVIINVTDVDETPVAPPITPPLSQRTLQVRDAIVAAAVVHSAAEVTPAHLAAITELDLLSESITALKSGDFDGLTALTRIGLGSNALSSLPSGLFDDLTALQVINLSGNSLSTFPAGLFNNNTALTQLWLSGNSLSSLPSGVFDNLTALTQIHLFGNRLSSLPSDVFDDLTALTTLDLGANSLSSLPSGIFNDLTALTTLRLIGNSLSSLPSGIFDNLTALTELGLSSNTLSDVSELEGLTSLTALYLFGNLIADYGPLRRLKAANPRLTLDITIPAEIQITPVSQRTPQVRDAIVAAVPDVNSADDVTATHLAAMTTLDLRNTSITALKLGDFDDLTALTELSLGSNGLSSLPSGIFDDLTALTTLGLSVNSLSSLSAGIFNNTTALTVLWLSGNDLSSLPSGIFDTLTALEVLYLNGNTLTDVSELEDLTSLTELYLTGNPITDYEPLRRLVAANPGLTLDITIPAVNPNNAPVFTDGTSATRTIAENTAAGSNIGTPVSATDADTDTLTYTLTGTDAAAFSIVSSSGQLQTRAALDYETKNAYAVIVSVSDGNSGTDSITVIISVTDVDETPVAPVPAGDTPGPVDDQPGDTPQQPQQPVDQGTPQQPVDTGITPTLTASPVSPLTERTLSEGVVKLTLSGAKYETSVRQIRNTVSVSGIAGVTLPRNQPKRRSNTEITAKLVFDGTNFDVDSVLTFTIGAGAIAGYTGPALTAEVPVTAVTETLVATTGAALTEPTLNESIVTLTLSSARYKSSVPKIRDAVSVSGITGVTLLQNQPRRKNNTTITAKVTFDGTDFDTDSTLIFTIGADALTNYEGPALTAHVSVAAEVEPVATGDQNGDTPQQPQQPVDQGTPQQPVDTGATPTLVATTVSPLTEATLNGSIVTLTLSGATYERAVQKIRDAVSVSGITGVTLPRNQPRRKNNTTITAKVTFDGTDFNTDSTLIFTIGAGAIAEYTGTPLTAHVSVAVGVEPVVPDDQSGDTTQQPVDQGPPQQPVDTGVTPTLTSSTASPLTEPTLHEGVVTLTLSGGTYERSIFDIKNAVSVSGITGVTVGTFGIDRISDTKVEIELEFAGNMNTDGMLTFTVGAGAIAGYSGVALTTQISVTAVTESLVASTPSPLTEGTLDGGVVSLTLSGAKYERSIFDIKDAVSVSGIAGVTFDNFFGLKRVSDTEITIELAFAGDMTTDGTLTFTVGADAIAGYGGPVLTAQVSVTAIAAAALLRNFPNPFNPETWIPYQLSKPADVTLRIYDIQGRVVRALDLGHQRAGIYQSRSRAAYWDGRNALGEPVASGLYFYTLIAGDFSATRKMLIRK